MLIEIAQASPDKGKMKLTRFRDS